MTNNDETKSQFKKGDFCRIAVGILGGICCILVPTLLFRRHRNKKNNSNSSSGPFAVDWETSRGAVPTVDGDTVLLTTETNVDTLQACKTRCSSIQADDTMGVFWDTTVDFEGVEEPYTGEFNCQCFVTTDVTTTTCNPMQGAHHGRVFGNILPTCV